MLMIWLDFIRTLGKLRLRSWREKEGNATWGQKGYYFAEYGVHYWQDVADAIAEEVYKQGFLESEDVVKLEAGERDLLKPVDHALWNVGASCRYDRAEELFGWEPREKGLMDEIGEIVRTEVERGGFKRV